MYSRVYIEITNICNMKCSFCHGHSRLPRRMTSDEFKHLLDELSGKTEYIYYHLMGEPLTHPDLPLFLQMAKGKGFQSVITTNGTLLKKRQEELIASGVHKVSISVHSLENADFDAFERYMREVTDFADVASRAGIIVVFRLWNKGCDDGLNEKVLTYLQDCFEGEWAENTRGVRIRKKLHLEWGDRFVWPDIEAPLQHNEVFCYGLSDHFGILSDGTVVPCCMDSDGVIALGNAFEKSLGEILSSPRSQAIRQGFVCRRATEELCRRCAYARRFL